MCNVPYDPPTFPLRVGSKYERAVLTTVTLTEEKCGYQGLLECRRRLLLAAASAMQCGETAGTQSGNELCEPLLWQLNLWSKKDNQRWTGFIREAWKRLEMQNPAYVKQQEEFLRHRKNPWAHWHR